MIYFTDRSYKTLEEESNILNIDEEDYGSTKNRSFSPNMTEKKEMFGDVNETFAL